MEHQDQRKEAAEADKDAHSAGPATDWTHRWYWRCRLPERKGQQCRVLSRGRKGTVLVEFPDGYRITTSWRAIRKVK